MPDNHDLTFAWAPSLSLIDRLTWNEMAFALPTPFLEYEWLSLLETSGSVVPDTGWEPRYLLARRGDRLVAACPLYRKTHSEGEFVFDYLWAEVAGRIGVPYFPKLVGMSPVTPVGAFRFLVSPGEDVTSVTAALSREIIAYAESHGFSGVHLQYTDPAWQGSPEEWGFTRWEHPAYLWTNPGILTFDDFLLTLSKNTRRNIRREEDQIAAQGITIRVLAGDEIDPGWHEIMYRYYLATNEKFGYWAALYLTGDFFKGLFEHFRHRLAVAAAFRSGEDTPLAMALFLVKGDRLWGRYWGSREYIPGLHFNVCYDAPFRWAIEHRLKYFDPGIGTEHKARRGFTACLVSSFHRFTDERLNQIFKANVGQLNRHARRAVDDLNSGVFHDH